MAERVTRQYTEVLGQGAAKDRVTRQYVEVLGKGAAKVRATRQYVEILSDAVPGTIVSALSTIYLSQTINTHNVLSVNASSTILLVDSRYLDQTLGVFSTLVPVDTAYVLLNGANLVKSTIELNETVAENSVANKVATDSLLLTNMVVASLNNFDASDLLSDLHDVANIDHSFYNTSPINLWDKATYTGPTSLTASDLLQSTAYSVDLITSVATPYLIGLVDSALSALVPGTPKAISHLLSFSSQALGTVIHSDAIAANATDTLIFTELGALNKLTTANHSLVLNDSVVALTSKLLLDNLSLSDVASINGVFSLTALDQLVLGDAHTYISYPNVIQWVYHPFIGSGMSGQPTPPTAILQSPSPGTGFCQFMYPVISPVDTIILRNPELGNKDRLQFNRISRETRGGTLLVFADPIWPKIQTLVLTFSYLTQTQTVGLIEFIQNHLGVEVGFVDWERNYWKGIITNVANPVIQDGKNMYTVNLEFEGALTPWV